MDPPQVTDVQYENAWIPLNHSKSGKTAMSHAARAVTKKTCESCSIGHIHWPTKQNLLWPGSGSASRAKFCIQMQHAWR